MPFLTGQPVKQPLNPPPLDVPVHTEMPPDYRRASAARPVRLSDPGCATRRTTVASQSTDLAATFAPRKVSELMISAPKTLPMDTRVEAVLAAFEDSHVHMLLLTHRGTLCGTLLRSDLPPGLPHDVAVLPFATVRGRTVRPDQCISTLHEWVVRSGQRRLAVVNNDGRLLGLLCLKSDRAGFCTDEGVAAREHDQHAESTPTCVAPAGRVPCLRRCRSTVTALRASVTIAALHLRVTSKGSPTTHSWHRCSSTTPTGGRAGRNSPMSPCPHVAETAIEKDRSR